MPCPQCGKETPGESFCSVECMNAYEEGLAGHDEKELERRYNMLRTLTRDYTECPFCRLKLVLSKPKPIDEGDEDPLNTLERNKFCPKCYRVYGFLIKDDLQDDWLFEPLYYEEAYDLLLDLGKILKHEKDIFEF
ncbi:MAG: hypothetical protein ACTSRS_12310 [Candidatus Helarchaeota archaeon]